MFDRFSVYLCLLVALLIPASVESNHQGIFQLDALAMQPQLNAHESCPTALPPDLPFTPPLPYQQKPSDGAFWYGTEKLWTGLDASGLWGGLRNDKGYREKVFWFRQGYIYRVEPKPALTVTGRRLDGESAVFTISDATNAYMSGRSAMLTTFEIPTAGCWELTGEYHGDALSFVVWVEPKPLRSTN